MHRYRKTPKSSLNRKTPVRGVSREERNKVAQRLARRLAQRMVQNPTEAWLLDFIRKQRLSVKDHIVNPVVTKESRLGQISIRKIEADGTCLLHSLLYLICPTYGKLALRDQQRAGIAFRIQMAEIPVLREIREALLEIKNGRHENLYIDVGVQIADYLGYNLVKLTKSTIELFEDRYQETRPTLAVYFESSHFDAVVTVMPPNLLTLYHQQFYSESSDSDYDSDGDSDGYSDGSDGSDGGSNYGSYYGHDSRKSRLQLMIEEINGLYDADFTDIITGLYVLDPTITQAQVIARISEMFSGRRKRSRKYKR
jgi:hypothetical protein